MEKSTSFLKTLYRALGISFFVFIFFSSLIFLQVVFNHFPLQESYIKIKSIAKLALLILLPFFSFLWWWPRLTVEKRKFISTTLGFTFRERALSKKEQKEEVKAFMQGEIEAYKKNPFRIFWF